MFFVVKKLLFVKLVALVLLHCWNKAMPEKVENDVTVASKIIFIIFWNFLMIEQIFLSQKSETKCDD